MENPHSHRTNGNPMRLERQQMDARSQHLRKGSGAASSCASASANSRRTPDFHASSEVVGKQILMG